MRILAKNSAIGQTAEDVISKGGVYVPPTIARKHAIVSNSIQDDRNGTLQIETATAAGTIAGIAQVETATVVGTIGAAGAGNAKVTVTGALITGSPLEIAVAVANNDTASQVAGKIRTALAVAGITTNYTVGGATDKVILTAKAVGANDSTLNVAIDNDTCTGLTAAPTSANTTAGHAGTGNAAVVITSANVTGSPLTVNVPVTVGDTAAVWAGKVRTALGNVAAITDKFTVGGATDKIILTAKTGLANDTTLNIALDNGTSNGITTAATSADTAAGVAGTGAHAVEISGIDGSFNAAKEIVMLNGTTAVDTVNSYLAINEMRVKSAGTGGKNAGLITATAATDSTISSQIEVGENKSQYAVYGVAKNSSQKVKFFNASAVNATGGAVTSVSILTLTSGGVWTPEFSVDLDSTNPTFRDVNSGLIPELKGGTFMKVQALASAGSSAVNVNMDIQ